jgi:two-component system phosphate regulon response regulator PhoB
MVSLCPSQSTPPERASRAALKTTDPREDAVRRNVLIVENAAPVAESIRANLTQAGLSAAVADSAEGAREMISVVLPDLILLNWVLPGEPDGRFATQLRANVHTQNVPLIIMGDCENWRRTADRFRITVDGYVAKPWQRGELIARVGAVLRLRQIPRLTDEAVSLGGLTIDPATRRVLVERDGTKLVLPVGPTELRLLYFLMTNPNRIIRRAELMEQVWSGQDLRDERSVDGYVRRLRGALQAGASDKMIKAVRGFGYQFSVD